MFTGYMDNLSLNLGMGNIDDFALDYCKARISQLPQL